MHRASAYFAYCSLQFFFFLVLRVHHYAPARVLHYTYVSIFFIRIVSKEFKKKTCMCVHGIQIAYL